MNFKMHEVKDKKCQPSAVYLSLFASLQIYVHICYLQPKFNFVEQSPGEKGGLISLLVKNLFKISPGATRDSSGWASKQSTPDISLEF
jgi:hypothetical protein